MTDEEDFGGFSTQEEDDDTGINGGLFWYTRACCFDPVNGCVTAPLLLCWHFWEKMLVIL